MDLRARFRGLVMNWFTGLIVYVLVWWVTLFAVLPLWVVPTGPGELGHAAGAPKQPRLMRKAVVTTLVAAVIWLAIYALVRSPWLSFRGA
jgi:predicted secreted protein